MTPPARSESPRAAAGSRCGRRTPCPIACARPARAPRSVVITTTGDRSQQAPVAGDDSKRQFVKELEDALLARRRRPRRPQREGPARRAARRARRRGVPAARGSARRDRAPRHSLARRWSLPVPDALARLGRGATIGTGSVRRVAQLAPLVHGATFAPIRGNVDTRLAKLDSGELRRAGARLRRPPPPGVRRPHLGAPFQSTSAFRPPVRVLLPLRFASTTRRLERRCRRFTTRRRAERSRPSERWSTALGGGCQLPLGAIAGERDGTLEMLAVVASLDGSRVRAAFDEWSLGGSWRARPATRRGARRGRRAGVARRGPIRMSASARIRVVLRNHEYSVCLHRRRRPR